MSSDSPSTDNRGTTRSGTSAASHEDLCQVVVADPCAGANPRLVAAAARAGAYGLLDVADSEALARALPDLRRRRVEAYWLRPGRGLTPAHLSPAHLTGTEPPPPADGPQATTVVLTADRTAEVAAWRTVAGTVLVQVVSAEEARAAVAAGADGLLASGREAGGRVGPTEASILLQQVVGLGVPVWVRGGIGPHTAAAAVAGGAVGVVVDVQTGLLRESSLAPEARQALAGMDGSQTRVVGGHRLFTRPDLPVAALPDDTPAADVAARLGADLRADLLPWGQDGASASRLAAEHVTVGGLVQGLRAAVRDHLRTAAEIHPLAPGAALAQAHGTTYPIAQGPMTRVSDTAGFADAVAGGGALPFLALALMPGHEVRALLEQTRDLLGDKPWGVGVLGFAPAELLAEQLAVVREVAPGFALVAGGRPSQSADLETDGITSYLHVPSIGLLDRFLKDGARKFVFEGRECGGHVGPLSSFVLWEAQLARLAEVKDVENLHVLLAGGIHDARSAAMAAAALAPLAARGAKVGVLMGTAYLFTAEAVSGGAVEQTFQDVAVQCSTTSLVETAPGHATRCVETDFVRAFEQRKSELVDAEVPAQERWAELEQLNLGRLRIASKGLVREEQGLTMVEVERQLAEGMYMIGEVATLRDRATTVADLHDEVSRGSGEWLGTPERVSVREREVDPLDVAVVGLASLLPGSTDTEGFWADVLAARDAVTEVPASRWNTDLYYDADAYDGKAGVKSPSKWGGFLDPVGFDPLAYGIPPAALAAVEPVQLLSLEVAARALADAGYATRAFDRARASVVFGAESGNDLSGMYGIRAWLPQLFDGAVPAELEGWLPKLTEDSFPGVLANVIAGRIANRLDLGGVNYTVDAACASSLAALDAGCKELVAGTSDLVLVGGADLHNGLNDYLMFSSVHALSPSGRCRTFDGNADGIALGEGIACVVLKRRVDAERDGDRIYALIDAVAGSSDGRHLGLTAPRKEGQQRAVVRALEQSGLAATDITLVEAHGTGTVVGDKTEMATLTELFAEAGAEPGSAVLGSVKSQIGHTKCSAGLAGLIKVVKAVHHGVLPPTINLNDPNPYYDATTSPFRFLDAPQPWPAEQRRAGVSAFGFGGTNFHAVVSSYDADDRAPFGAVQWSSELFCFRGRTLDEARSAASDLADKVAQVLAVDPAGQRHRLRDLAATVAATGSGPVRVALVADSLEHLAVQLSRVAGGTDAREGVYVQEPAQAVEPAPVVGFLYPGQGSQRPGMLSELFVTFGGLDDLLRAGERYLPALFPPKAFTREERAAQQAAITATDVAQPTLGLASMAMTRLLRRAGVEPAAAGGHSYGELAALAAAGAYDEATLIELSAARGESVLQAVEASGGDPGTMAALALPIDEVRALAAEFPTLVVANHNSPKQVVLAGPTADVRAAVQAWGARGVRATLLPVACAFHSPLIATAGQRLAERIAPLDLRAPRIPVWSNVTAEPYPVGDDAAVGRLLVDQVTEGVRFVEQVESMYAAGVRVFVEAGPGRVLTGSVGKILGDRPHTAIACDASGESGLRRFLLALAELAGAGVEIDPSMLFEGRAQRLDLASLPVATPGWTVDGALVRRADGTVLPNSLQPADTLPDLAPSSLPSTSGAPMNHPTDDWSQGGYGTDPGAVVHEYLRSVRQLVAAERDVMLRYLGAELPASAAYDHDAAPLVQPVQAVVARVEPVTPVVEPVETPVSTSSTSGPSPVETRLTTADLMAAVQQVVADRTGYPVDMLEPDLDLEADLSIDSIKRLEIVGELADTLGLGDSLSGGEPDEALVEELAKHKTLRAVVGWLEENLVPTGTAPPVEPVETSEPVGTSAPAATTMTTDELLAAVQQVVADRTGYPVDMLEPDLDLEADLSIDSIKRLEIVGELADTLGLGDSLSGGEPDEALVEELAKHKTLRAVVGWLEENLVPTGDAVSTSSTTSTTVVEPVDTPVSTSSTTGGPDSTPDLGRAALREVIVEPLGPTLPIGDLAGQQAAVLIGDDALSDALGHALAERGASVTLLTALDVREDHDGQAAALLADVDVLVDLSTTAGTGDARSVFMHLRPALLGRATRVLTVGPAVHPDGTPTGVPGLLRSAAREKTDKLVRSVEIEAGDLAGDVTALAAIVVDELLDHEAPLSVSWAGGQRTTRITGEPTPASAPDSLPLDAESVVLLTGGARGITARVAADIAAATGCRLVLVGRSALPGEEDPRLAEAGTTADLRRALLAIGELRTPAEIEAACTRIAADREIRGTLAALGELAASVEYVAVDVRAAEFGDALDDVRRRYGRLDVVVHGAGVLDDRFIADKTDAGFDGVYGTKVDGARTILARQEGTRMVVLFGSVSGVFGNRGQSDYSAGNDALDTLARTHDGRHGCRVIALDWGPWGGGGMVSADLEREYARRGIGLVDPADGAAALLTALSGSLDASQFVVMTGDPAAFAPPVRPGATGALTR
ncbi:MAG: SDR family NAD(P)-dependent oxidoreductase [Nocardioides sp.]|uniref:SDR family NAD(P)-dependent oxidoreductase n=1 Tax=Nocardioides sp. TaxID=35761 RepID=UPI003F1073D4